jgi:branched-chain amino acid transport system ATP-binding protein
MLEVRDLWVRYGAVRALRGVSLTVEKGEIVAVVGANGAGKSTLLGTLAGTVPVEAGEIRFEGSPLAGLPPEAIARRGVSLMPEGRRIFTTLTVEENLRVAAAWRSDRRAIARDLDRVLQRFPILRDRFKASAGAMSGGEQQQLAIARALMADPKLLMLDEPSLGLAPKLVRSVMDTLLDLRAEGYTILLVEQNVADALRVADRVYVLQVGELKAAGTPEELRDSGEIELAYLGEAG